ncbi:FAD-binding domain-containing protein [Gonapodya prolifera JEL478]|uniref:D-2-hydroxyglutarate dehydrogenase, mitochondrial n=1 Tax=Gonapodya prolifera (strain JEL478) TaxID=1344416 RepID=A0A139A6H7_GONPJ|nr:FAD-binding domain-containing protein [Gonapodya prolifera JEL478]|eukprot:KXS12045.1 FAD-binding domain-containing protein [Gonapodya prolifera JEL478]
MRAAQALRALCISRLPRPVSDIFTSKPTSYLRAPHFQTTPYSTSSPQQKLAADMHPHIKRSTAFKSLDDADINHFKSFLEPSQVITDQSEVQPYNTDWMKKYRGQTVVVLRPKTTEEVQKIVRYCNEKKLAVCPQGGNTGLVGGSVPVFDEVVISLTLMNQVRSLDEVSGAFVADAGLVLETADNYLAERGFIFPLDLGAKGTATIGGNVATNAGGLRLLRYGSLHGTVLGLEVVLPDGTLFSNLSTLRKDNTGYDLKQLFIGAEGTLGIITGVSIMAPRRPNAVNVAVLALDSFELVQESFARAKRDLGEILSAFEFWDQAAAEVVHKYVSHVKNPFMEGDRPAPAFGVLIETSGSVKEHDDEKLSRFLESLMEDSIVTDGVVADSETQAKALWGVRESITEGLSRAGAAYKYDISMPVPKLYSAVEDMRERLASKGFFEQGRVARVVGFGHLGDGNLHLNIGGPQYDKEVAEAIEPYVFQWLKELDGSISAEHGLGLHKAEHLHYSKPDRMISIMKQIKDLFDPNGIMNPYKYLPKS